MTIGALHVGLSHKACDLECISLWQTLAFHGRLNEVSQIRKRNFDIGLSVGHGVKGIFWN
jgi:hypothetical protein